MSGYLPVPPALVGKLPETINKENKETPILLGLSPRDGCPRFVRAPRVAAHKLLTLLSDLCLLQSTARATL